MKLFQMALRNVRKYYRHYLIVFFIVLAGTVTMLSKVMIKESEEITKQEYNRIHYGTWYVTMPQDELDNILSQEIEIYAGNEQNRNTTLQEVWDGLCENAGEIQSTTVYEQGYVNSELFGYIAPDAYNLFGIQITEGKERSNDNEVLISSNFASKQNLSVGDHLTLKIDSVENTDYTISGIFTNYNEGMPEVLTNYITGTGYYYSDNSIATYDVGFDYYSMTYSVEVGESRVINSITLNFTINPNGVDAKNSNTTFSTNFSRIQLFYQTAFLLAIVITVLTNTSLKRRAKESSLLRGIGATAGQLILLTIDEMSIVLFLTTVIGYILSYGILRYYGYLKTALYGFYNYAVDWKIIVIYCIGIIVIIDFITFLPMRSSAIGALTGAFEAPKPKMLEGRECKWVSQTPYIMAKRQLRSYSKLTTCLTIFVLLAAGYAVTYFSTVNSEKAPVITGSQYRNKVYIQETFDSLEDENTYLSFFDEDSNIITLEQKQTSNSTNGVISQYDPEFIDLFELEEGTYPQNNNEVLISSEVSTYDTYYAIDDPAIEFEHEDQALIVDGIYYLDWYEEHGETYYRKEGETSYHTVHATSPGSMNKETEYSTEYLTINGKLCDHYSYAYDENKEITGIYTLKYADLGDTILIDGQEMTIVGILDGSKSISVGEGHWNTYYSIYTNQNIYVTDAFYTSLEDPVQYSSYVLFDLDKEDQIVFNLYNYFQRVDQPMIELTSNSLGTTSILDVSSFNLTYFLILVGVGIILCFFLNLNNMLNDIKNYAILHLIGMSKQGIIYMHLMMALAMSVRVWVFLAIYDFFLYVGFGYVISLVPAILIIIGIFVFFTLIYVIPSFYIVRGNLLENLNGDE